MSCNMGDLVPIVLEEILPGDSMRINSEIMMRLAPMLFPVMHRVDVWVHFFFVPTRTIWSEFELFITGGADGLGAPVAPYLVLNNSEKSKFVKGSLYDYFGGFPVTTAMTVANNLNISALPFRAYQKIFNEYYRDQTLSTLINYSIASGQMTGGEYANHLTLRQRSWEKDYFTSSLPFAQRGTNVQMPINASVSYKQPSLVKNSPAGTPAAYNEGLKADGSGNLDTLSDIPVYLDNIDTITSTSNPAEWRRAFALQRILERLATGGSRYVELLKSFWGVKPSDASLQRAQYLGGGKAPVVISEVLSTVKEATNPQGWMTGHGIGVGNTNRFTKEFEEHGYVVGVMSTMPRTAYQNGVPKKLCGRTSRFDYAWPELAHIGEQEVKRYELYYDPTTGGGGGNSDTFGYQSRYAEYKYAPSRVAGDFRDTLNFAHMGRIFSAAPTLNEDFIKANPTHRIFANTTPTDHKLWCQLYNDVSVIRALPYFGDPKIM